MSEILPIRRNVEHRNAVDTLYGALLIHKVFEVQTFYKNDKAGVLNDAEKFMMRQSHDSRPIYV